MAISTLLERYHPRDSAVHRADARVKLVAALVYIFAITFTREGDWTALVLLAVPVAAVVVASRLPLRLVLGRALLALPFLLVAVPLLFTRPGETIAQLPVLGWTVSDEGAVAVATILAKSWLSVIIAVVLMATTEAPSLLRSLRALRLPRLLVASIEFAYRYLFVVTDEASRMLQARASRSAALEGRRSGGTVRWRGRVAGNLVGTLFVRSIERSERVHAAMLARGYDGEPRQLAAPALDRSAAVVAALVVLYGCAVQVGVRL
ncbi:MAG: cobalt ECF transporter T component CbiQ [Chloroflexota bacterium]|nr:cobalt ECF transporter T component CbiQ [Chloroflexota bacterium]